MLRALLSALLVLVPTVSFAEGTAELGAEQSLRAGTQVFAQGRDPSTETIVWQGMGAVDVEAPNGTDMGTVASGVTITPLAGVPGNYALTVDVDQTVAGWDVRVRDGTNAQIPGRVYSLDWRFDAGSFAQSAESNASFYILVPIESGDAVIELDFEGLAGFVYEINANAQGVDGQNAGQSVPTVGNSITPRYQIYLNPPDLATYIFTAPAISDFAFGAGEQSCNLIIPGTTQGSFRFTSNVEGTYHIVCDLNQDGFFDKTDPADLFLLGSAEAGENSVTWDGTTRDGSPVPSGEYDCRAELNVGEFHYVGRDIETSYEGLRTYLVNLGGTRTPLPMYWNDSAVQANAEPMLNAQLGLETSGPDGLLPNTWAQAATPNVNARAWGEFDNDGKGNQAYLDTFSSASTSVSGTVQVDAVPNGDRDGEGLSDYLETCELGTDPDLRDTDGDLIDDFVETDGGAPTDTDADDIIDALDPDSDGDTIADLVEARPTRTAIWSATGGTSMTTGMASTPRWR